MHDVTTAPPSSWLARIRGAFTALAEAMDVDSLGYADARFARLERRVAILEGGPEPLLPPVGN